MVPTDSALSRRGLLAMAGTAGLATVAGLAPATPEGRPPVVRMDVDGLGLTPADFAALLQQLSAGLAPDEYSLGGEVEKLEALFATLLGKETAVFLPSGTLANHLAVRRLARGRPRILVQADSHLYNDSGDCAERLSALNLVPLLLGEATLTRKAVEEALARTATGRVATGVGVVSIESPVRRLHGATCDLEEMRAISRLARERGIGMHLDGARLIVASAYSGLPPADYAALFDTVYVSLWKSFSSGSGAILVGSRATLEDLYQDRRMFGGALHAAWPFAAVARHHAPGVIERLRTGIAVSEEWARLLGGAGPLTLERVPNGTSRIRLAVPGIAAPEYRARLLSLGVVLPEPEADASGFWLTVNETWARMSAARLAAAFRQALG